MIEGRGEGILAMAHEASAVVRCVVDLIDPQAGLSAPLAGEAARKQPKSAAFPCRVANPSGTVRPARRRKGISGFFG